MLTQLSISNFAIIDKLEINFNGGLTVLTGETGAGKSIIVHALDFLLGSRANAELIKSGKDKAVVEGIFFVETSHGMSLQPWLVKNDFEINESSPNEIIISRELSNAGSKARINGSLANISHLSYLREQLVDIHGQSEHIDLLKTEKQLEILDNFGEESHKKLLEKYKKEFGEYGLLKAKLNYLQNNSASLRKKIDFLEFQIYEIKEAKIKDLEEENKLQEKRQTLLNKKELQENATNINEIIDGDGRGAPYSGNLLSNLSTLKNLISRSAAYDKLFEPFIKETESMTSIAKEISSFARDYLEHISTNENELTEIEERLDLFYRLKKKYGNSLKEILEVQNKLESELSELRGGTNSFEEIEKAFNQKEKEINELAEKLTSSREKITKRFVDKINEELPHLGFKQVLFVVEFTTCDLLPSGKEQIQFLFTSNPNEPPKPIVKVASGGELSRIMLAIKSLVCRGLTNQTPTMIFDEIDIGTSGEIAANVARKLYKISKENQVVSITHQPIIAAMADEHFLIEKDITENETFIRVNKVTKESKEEALVNLLAPEKRKSITSDAKQFARSLIESAKRMKEKELVELR